MNPNCRSSESAKHTPAYWRRLRTRVTAPTIDVFGEFLSDTDISEFDTVITTDPASASHSHTMQPRTLSKSSRTKWPSYAMHSTAFDTSSHPRPGLKHNLWMSIPVVTESVAEHGTFYAHDVHLQPKKKLTGTCSLCRRLASRLSLRLNDATSPF